MSPCSRSCGFSECPFLGTSRSRFELGYPTCDRPCCGRRGIDHVALAAPLYRMLTAEKNELLTRVGPGTPMGNLLRRYWMPIGGASELDAAPIKPVRLMGEDLVLYRDRAGRYGLVDRHCPHRRADLAYGWVEEHGIRCSYHGWLFDEAGSCLEQP